MRNNLILRKFVGLFLFIFVFFAFPKIIFAATIYFTSAAQNVYVGDIFIVEVKISSPNELINVIDGKILFDRNKTAVQEFSTGGSVFSLWAQKPAFSNTEGKISFVGGAPSGFQEQEGTVLKIIFIAKEKGESQINFSDDTLVFLSDGKGTEVKYQRSPFALSILERPKDTIPKDEWQKIVKEDKIPPEPFEVAISKNPAMFDNRYFISFYTTDRDSGIAYYEIKEGNFAPVRGESPYLLNDQSLGGDIQVKAVDRAGNERIETVPVSRPSRQISFASYKMYLIWGIIIIALLIVFVISAILLKFLKAKNRNRNGK